MTATMQSTLLAMDAVLGSKLPKAPRWDDSCTYESEDFKAECFYRVDEYPTADDCSQVTVLWIDMDFGGRKTIQADEGHFGSLQWEAITDACRVHCDEQDALAKAGRL